MSRRVVEICPLQMKPRGRQSLPRFVDRLPLSNLVILPTTLPIDENLSLLPNTDQSLSLLPNTIGNAGLLLRVEELMARPPVGLRLTKVCCSGIFELMF